MKIIIEFRDINEYLEFKEKTALENEILETEIYKAEAKSCSSFPLLTPYPYENV